ncbi:hypothetical protein J6590_047048 [Homalodisca vitripennis]|nr:hypothetical protein J6590_047048 [Homalodisca vitripennis]
MTWSDIFPDNHAKNDRTFSNLLGNDKIGAFLKQIAVVKTRGTACKERPSTWNRRSHVTQSRFCQSWNRSCDFATPGLAIMYRCRPGPPTGSNRVPISLSLAFGTKPPLHFHPPHTPTPPHHLPTTTLANSVTYPVST